MKTRILIITAILALGINISYSNTNASITSHRPVELRSDVEFLNLAPITPNEAAFEDGPESLPIMEVVLDLVPTTPKEADFDDVVTDPSDYSNLAPTAPLTAPFDEKADSPDFDSTCLRHLAPVTPTRADF